MSDVAGRGLLGCIAWRTLARLAWDRGMDAQVVYKRVRVHGWQLERALSTPVRGYARREGTAEAVPNPTSGVPRQKATEA